MTQIQIDLTTLERPTVQLIGRDGNAFSILGRCARAAREAGWSTAAIDQFRDEATKGDYNHLLCTVMRYFDEPEPEYDEEEDEEYGYECEDDDRTWPGWTD